MATDILRRSYAPITGEAWQMIDEEAARMLRGQLSARQLVDFNGPLGWEAAAVNYGTLDISKKKTPVDGVKWGTRKVQPLVEARVAFKIPQMDLDSVTRGSETPELGELEEAARKIAAFEENAIYNGLDEACIRGLAQASENKPVAMDFKDPAKFDDAVATAVEALQLQGVNGPYALVLGTAPYQALMRGFLPGGYPLVESVKTKIRGEVVWSPVLKGGVALSQRGGDFELTVGQDLSIGYCRHDGDDVEFYFAESFTFRVLEGRAVVPLQSGGK